MNSVKIKCKNFIYDYFYKYKFLNTAEKRKAIKSNSQFQNAYDGKRCFIIGNGPSIMEQDLTKLRDEYVFMVNQSMRMPEYQEINPQFHILADPRYYSLDSSIDEDHEVIECIRNLGSMPDIKCFFPILADYSDYADAQFIYKICLISENIIFSSM